MLTSRWEWSEKTNTMIGTLSQDNFTLLPLSGYVKYNYPFRKGGDKGVAGII
jgi:hypothetical protein